ncbi:MAG: trehalose-phosphatase [Saprospiraceae bacterium]|nr:trehalose-phosphatase [Saprospiraceae bacterium]
MLNKYKNATHKLILLDYDGTLVNFSPLPEEAVPSQKILNLLLKLVKQPKSKIVIITGRSHEDIDRFLGHIPLDIIAEHGAMIKENGIWKKLIASNTLWKESFVPLFNRFALTCSGSFVVEKHFSLTWHYRNAEPKLGYAHSRDLISILEDHIQHYNLKILDGNKVVEIIDKEIGKGNAVKQLVEKGNYDYILSIGDDKTDEEMFDMLLLNNNAHTVKVGEGNTVAKHRVNNVDDVISLLEEILQ